MLLDIEMVIAEDNTDADVQALVRKGYHIKEILLPAGESKYYRFVLVKPILPKKEWELDDS